MHIPDNYLSPQTYSAAYLLVIPFWVKASRVVSRTLRARQVPLLALGAAFSFIIMMFNVPTPFGSATGHATGAVLVAILLGPWAATIAITVALVVQALLFNDGGLLSLGANCLNMAVIMPFVGYLVYKLISGKSELDSKKRAVAAVFGGYFGILAAAVATAFELGIQPIIAHDVHGVPLYAPFGLKTAMVAMVGSHLLFFGFIEAAITGMVIRYLQKADLEILKESVLARKRA